MKWLIKHTGKLNYSSRWAIAHVPCVVLDFLSVYDLQGPTHPVTSASAADSLCNLGHISQALCSAVFLSRTLYRNLSSASLHKNNPQGPTSKTASFLTEQFA